MELYLLLRPGQSTEESGDDANVNGNGNYDYDWYLIDDNSGHGGPLFPIRGMSMKLPSKLPMCTSLGSTIYTFGCINNSTATTTHNWILDLKPTNPLPYFLCSMDVDARQDDLISGKGWITVTGQSMLFGRPKGIVIADGKMMKIFVFSNLKHPEYWAQVYDVQSREWSVLMPPQDILLAYGPPFVGGVVVLQQDHMDSSLLLYFPQLYCLYSYNMATQKWDILDNEFGDSWGPLTLSATLSGTCILLAMDLNLHTMFGYHVDCKKWLPVAGLNRKHVLPPPDVLCDQHPCIRIISGGSSGELCLLWSVHSSRDSEMSVTCTEFALHERNGGYVLDANVGRTKHFTIEDTDNWIYCLALTRSWTRDDSLGFENCISMDNARLYVLVRDYHSSGDTNLHSNDDNHKYNWYLIEDDTSQGALSPSASMSHNFPYYTWPTCLGSTICILGGSNLALDTSISSDFWYLDINNAGSVWSKGPCMHVGRSGCFAIAAGEKLYAFGGRKQWYGIKKMVDSWGEVYDMRSNEWSRLIPPHKGLLPPTVGGGVVVDLDVDDDVGGSACMEKQKQSVMLLYLPELGSLISYPLATQKWYSFDSYFGSQWAGALVVSTNDILLAMNYKDNLMYGYNVVRKEWFPEPISGLESIPGYGEAYANMELLSLGSGKLCFFSSSRQSSFSPIRICCTPFIVSEIQDGLLTANVDTTREYTIDDSGDLCNCLALPLP